MTDQELRRMKRAKLLELLAAQIEENEALRTQLDETKTKLQSREITIQHAGSIADAALPLNGVFRAAEEAAQQYLENVKALSERQEEVCAQMEAEAKEKAQTILAEAEQQSKQLRAEADAYWEEVQQKVQAYCQDQECLRDLLQSGGKKPEVEAAVEAVSADPEKPANTMPVGQPQMA